MSRIALVLLLLINPVQAQQSRTVYGPDGRVQNRIATDKQGGATIYGADGRVQNRTSTDSQGTITIYDADGRKSGSVVKR
jgi:hypothetical protein